MAFMLLASKVHVLDTYSRIDRTSTTHYRHNCKSQRNYTVLYTEIHIDAQHITTLCLIKKIPNIFSCNSGMHSCIYFNNFWQEYFAESRQLKDCIISHVAWPMYLHYLVKLETQKLHLFT